MAKKITVPTWTTTDGRVIPITVMHSDHIANAKRCLQEELDLMGPFEEQSDHYLALRYWIHLFNVEQKRRATTVRNTNTEQEQLQEARLDRMKVAVEFLLTALLRICEGLGIDLEKEDKKNGRRRPDKGRSVRRKAVRKNR